MGCGCNWSCPLRTPGSGGWRGAAKQNPGPRLWSGLQTPGTLPFLLSTLAAPGKLGSSGLRPGASALPSLAASTACLSHRVRQPPSSPAANLRRPGAPQINNPNSEVEPASALYSRPSAHPRPRPARPGPPPGRALRARTSPGRGEAGAASVWRRRRRAARAPVRPGSRPRSHARAKFAPGKEVPGFSAPSSLAPAVTLARTRRFATGLWGEGGFERGS